MMALEPGQTHLPGNGRIIPNRKILIGEPDLFSFAVFGKLLDGGFQQRDAPMIAQRTDRVAQVVQTPKHVGILQLGLNVQFGRWVKRYRRPKVSDRDGNGFTKKSIGRVSE